VYKSGGGLATGRVQYITRTGPYQSAAEARVHHQGLEHGTDLVREDLVYWRARNFPQWSADDPVRYFSAAETYERANGVAYTEWRFSLPRELTRAQQMAAARALLTEAFGESHPYVWAFHDPLAADGGRQPHVHVIWSARTLDGIERNPEQFFRRSNAKHPERGGAQKDPGLNHMGAVKAARVQYTDIMNIHLEAAGHVARLHPDRLHARGIERTPEPRLSIKDSNAYKLHGTVTERMQAVLDHRQYRQQYIPQERVQARRYWEARKSALGLTRDMPMAEQLTHIREARMHAMTHAPERPTLEQLREQERTLAHDMRKLEQHVQDLQRAARREQRIDQRRERREWQGELAAERVLATGKAHGLPRDRQAEQMVARLERTTRTADVAQRLRGRAQALKQDEPQPGAALHIRLFDREEEHEREHERGMGW
jgi:hypothetical protein